MVYVDTSVANGPPSSVSAVSTSVKNSPHPYHSLPSKSSSNFIHNTTNFLFCVFGIYFCFLTWGILQERISTIDYKPGIERLLWKSQRFYYGSLLYNKLFLFLYKNIVSLSALFPIVVTEPSSTEKFSSFVFLNACQAISSWVVSYTVVSYYRFRCNSNYKNENDKPFAESTSASIDSQFPPLDSNLFWLYLKISIIYSISSPFAYASLKYIHYVAMNLGKACKLLPLVLIKIFVKREPIDKSKLINLLLITAGVIGFLLWENPSSKRKPPISQDITFVQCYLFNLKYMYSFVGIILLLINLFLDGLLNSFQDEVFSKYKLSPFHMMFYLNRNSTLLLFGYLFTAPWSTELGDALKFITLKPAILPDLVLFCACGALGQSIVFLTLGQFGAIFLVTVTVTRKLFTILLSVIYFGHSLTVGQWVSVCMVFIALIFEAILSGRKRRHHHAPVELAPTPSGKYQIVNFEAKNN